MEIMGDHNETLEAAQAIVKVKHQHSVRININMQAVLGHMFIITPLLSF